MNTNQRLAARAGQLRRWAMTADRSAALAPARAGVRAKFVRQAEAAGFTDPADIDACADRLYRAHMTDMARRSAAARRKTSAMDAA